MGGTMVRANKKALKGTIEALRMEIEGVKKAIETKLKAGDLRGANALQKKLSKLHKELYQAERRLKGRAKYYK